MTVTEEEEVKPVTVGFHFHAWTAWGEVFSSDSNGGLKGALVGNGDQGPWWQDRSCTKCNLTDRRKIAPISRWD